MSIRKDGLSPQGGKLQDMAETLLGCAQVIAKELGLDPLDAMGALGFAATKLAYRTFNNDADRLQAVRILCNAHNHAIGDMIAGKETTHQVRQ